MWVMSQYVNVSLNLNTMDYGKKMNAIDFTSRIEYNGQWSKENEWDELWSEGSNMECDDRRW